MKEKKEKEPGPQQRPGELPPIRVDNDVGDDEPRIEIGKKRASLPPPVPFNPREG